MKNTIVIHISRKQLLTDGSINSHCPVHVGGSIHCRKDEITTNVYATSIARLKIDIGSTMSEKIF
jgi:hypothetical protein